MKKGFLLLLLMSNVIAGDYQIHILKKGESLSEVLHKNGYTPLYGDDQWVQKTLDMNHLESIDAKEIKEGFPIILPSRKKVVDNKKAYQPISSNLIQSKRKKSFFKTISKHQDLYFDFSINQNEIKLPNSQINFKENYSISIGIDGKNNFHYRNYIYNINGGLKFSTNGLGNDLTQSGKTIQLRPSYSIFTNIAIDDKHIPFQFGPSMMLEEKSIIEEKDGSTITRREQIAWIGAQIHKSFKAFNYLYGADLKYHRKIFQKSLSEADQFETSQIEAKIKVNLTKNYKAGLFAKAITYDQINIKSENALGLSFNYLIK